MRKETNTAGPDPRMENAETIGSAEFVVADGKRLEIVRYGPSPEDAPTLVFLHEGLGCIAMWRDFPAQLAAATGCGALVYSRSGYGRSDPCVHHRPIRFMHHEGLKVLPELLDISGIRECILVGHSDGGSIAIIYAGGTPAVKLRGLITEAAHVFCEDLSVQSIQAARSLSGGGSARTAEQIPRPERGLRLLGVEPRVAASGFHGVEHRGIFAGD